MTEYIRELSKDVPVACEADVVVAGGGIAGTIAGISAARHKARVVVIDRFGNFGGNMGPGMFAGGSLHLAIKSVEGGDVEEALLNKVGMGGIPEEFCKRVIYSRPNAGQMTEEIQKALEGKHMNLNGYRVGEGAGLCGYLVDSQVVSYVAFKMMQETGVRMMLSAYAADPIMDGSNVKGVFVETKSGRLAIKGKVFIDATGEADVAFRAGAPMHYVETPNIGICFALKNVDWEKYKQFEKENPEANQDDIEWAKENMSLEKSEADPYPNLHFLLPFIRKAWEAREFEYVKKIGRYAITAVLKPPKDEIVLGRTCSSGKVNFSDAKEVSLMECEHRKYVFEYARFMRRYVLGFENSYLLITASYLGARGGRSIEAERAVTYEDVDSGRRFDDVIYIYYHGQQKRCEVPYRMLIPKKIDGLMAVGRSGMVYGPNLRVRHSVMLSAQAAGVAAALCAAEGVEPRNLDVKKLQKVLIGLGCPLGDENRLKELGLMGV